VTLLGARTKRRNLGQCGCATDPGMLSKRGRTGRTAKSEKGPLGFHQEGP
jgi:hypothetical protein